MPLHSPNLDDRTFDQLMEESLQRIRASDVGWTDLTPNDPGIVLLELFSHLTETMLYRLNRLPEKAFIEFLRLIGVTRRPPAAASVTLEFRREEVSDEAVEVRRGTRVTSSRTDGDQEPPIFIITRSATIPAGATSALALALHCRQIEAELVGKGTGLPGLSVQAKNPPLIAPTGDQLDLVVAIEVNRNELDERARTLQYNNKTFRVWREVDNFTNLGNDRHVYVVDRMTGAITFAPAIGAVQQLGSHESGSNQTANANSSPSTSGEALAATPPLGSEIRLWYRQGGGNAGNVAAGELTVLKDPISGITVINPQSASGGRAAESLDNVLIRGPQELHSLQRAITARDFELAALYSSRSVSRAKAVTRATLWAHATPGTVEVLLVPYLPTELWPDGRVTVDMLAERQTDPVREQIQLAIDERRPLGTTALANWARYKTVGVRTRIVVRREEDKDAVETRVRERINRTINPLSSSDDTDGWPYGQALRASHVYDIALAEPGVLWADRVRLNVDEAPDQRVASLAADAFQPNAWYAGSGSTLFRTLNNGDGWEVAGRFEDEQISGVEPHPDRAGMVAAVTETADRGSSRIHISQDSGESWPLTFSFAFEIHDFAWLQRDHESVVLLATDRGLFELRAQAGSAPVQILVNLQDQSMGFYAVTTVREVRGQITVAVAARETDGVFLSNEGGLQGTFRKIGLDGDDIRVLTIQYDGPRAFLWAGAFAAGGNDPGDGCFRWELRGSEDSPEGWEAFKAGWNGGSCRDVAFLGMHVLAASHRSGILRLDASKRDSAWVPSEVNSGLPQRDSGRFNPVNAVATAPQSRARVQLEGLLASSNPAEAGQQVLAGCIDGAYRSINGGAQYSSLSNKEFADKVTLPPTWLFCSGTHEITVMDEDEAERD